MPNRMDLRSLGSGRPGDVHSQSAPTPSTWRPADNSGARSRPPAATAPGHGMSVSFTDRFPSRRRPRLFAAPRSSWPTTRAAAHGTHRPADRPGPGPRPPEAGAQLHPPRALQPVEAADHPSAGRRQPTRAGSRPQGGLSRVHRLVRSPESRVPSPGPHLRAAARCRGPVAGVPPAAPTTSRT